MGLKIHFLVKWLGMIIVTKKYKEDPSPKLTAEQRREYADLKVGIQHHMEEGLKHFEAAGQMLLRVREARLYREEFPTFNDFCRLTFQRNRRYADRLISAFDVMEGLRVEGVVQLPDSERICRELAKYPKVDRVGILKRAQAIAKRRDPTYLQVRDAATAIVPTKAQRKVWVGQLLQRFRDAKRLLTINADFNEVTEPSMVEVVTLLVDIEKRVREISVQADKRVEHFLKNRIVNKDE